MRILNIAAGKFDPLEISGDNRLIPRFVLNVDTSYFSSRSAEAIELDIESWERDEDRISTSAFLDMDAFMFMERTRLRFDRVAIYRFLEHVTFTQVEYFIYLVSTILEPGGIVDVIVPNYKILAEMILDEDSFYEENNLANFPEHNILLTTELLNEPSCPHASIWTPDRMRYFWELENRFKVIEQSPEFHFDGRDIYLRSIIERV